MNSTKLEMHMSLGHNGASYCLHCMKMCSHVSISVSPHGQWIAMLRKNLCRYSPIGVCPSIMWVNLAYTELDIPICGSQDPPLVYVGLMTHLLLFSNLKKSCLFFLLSLNDFCHDSSRRSHSFFLLSKNKFFSERIGGTWDILASLSTRACLGHFSLLGQYQKCIELHLSFSRNVWILAAMGIMDFCRCWSPKLMILFPAASKSVMTIIWYASVFSSTNMRPMCIAMSSASNGMMLVVWALRQLVTLLSFQMWVTAVAEPIALTLLSVMTVIFIEVICVLLKTMSSFDKWTNRPLLLDDSGEWKVILSEKWSTNCKLGWKIEWKGSNSFLIFVSLSLTSLIGLFSLDYCLLVKLANEYLWGFWFLLWGWSRRELITCDRGIVTYLRWWRPLSFLR